MRILIVLLVILIVSCTWRPVMGQEDTKVFQKPVACKFIGTMLNKLNEEGFVNIIRFRAVGNTQIYVYILNPDYINQKAYRIVILETHPDTDWACILDEGAGAQFNVDFWEGFMGQELDT